MPSIVAVLPGNGLPSTEDWNAGLTDQQLDVVMRRWFPWTDEARRSKVAVAVGGLQTGVDVVYSAIENRQELFPLRHVMVPGARGRTDFLADVSQKHNMPNREKVITAAGRSQLRYRRHTSVIGPECPTPCESCSDAERVSLKIK